MLIAVLILLGIVFVIGFIFFLMNFFSMSIDDFFKKLWMKTMWLWLPIHALFRLSREVRDKNRNK